MADLVDIFSSASITQIGNNVMSSIFLWVVFSCSLYLEAAASYQVAGSALGSFGSSTVSAMYGMAFDASGNMLVAEYGNQIISKFTPSGVKSTLYSDGAHYPDSICVDFVTGNIVFGANSATIQRFLSINSAGTFLSSTTTYIQPFSCQFDTSGTLYLSDITSSAIYKSDIAFSFSTLVGSVNNIWTLFLDSSNHMFTADGYGKYVYRFDTTNTNYPLTGVVVAGTSTQNTAGSGDGGPATSAVLGAGGFVTADANGNIFYGSRTDCTIRTIDVSTGRIHALIGVTRQCGNSADGARMTSVKLSSNSGMRAMNDVLYFAELSGTKIRTITYNPVPTSSPTLSPTPLPSAEPSAAPSVAPSLPPTATPSVVPSMEPSEVPTAVPTTVPSVPPSLLPTATPSVVPSMEPTEVPTAVPTTVPSVEPSTAPSEVPTEVPSQPTVEPSVSPAADSSPDLSTGGIIGVAVGGFCFVLLLLLLGCWWFGGLGGGPRKRQNAVGEEDKKEYQMVGVAAPVDGGAATEQVVTIAAEHEENV